MSKTVLVVALLACCCLAAPAQDSQLLTSSQAAPARPVHVPGSEMLGLVDNKVMPQYPPPALTKDIEGTVIFDIVVDETGKLVSIHTAQGHPLLVAAGKDALSQYHFRPYVVDGSPVNVTSQMGFQFTVSKKGDSTDGQVECLSTLP